MSAPTPLTRIADLISYCDKKRLQYPDIVLYFSIKREGVGSGKIKKTDRTEFTEVIVSPTENGAMRPGVVYTITNSKDSDRVYFIATTGGVDTALTAVVEKVSEIKDEAAKRDALEFLSDQLMKGVLIQERQVSNLLKEAELGEKTLKQAEMIAGIQDKLSQVQDRLDKAQSLSQAVLGGTVVLNKLFDRLLLGRGVLDREVADGQGLNRLLQSQGVSPAQARAALERLATQGISLLDVVNQILTTEQTTEQSAETK